MKKALSIVIALAMVFAMSIPVFAAAGDRVTVEGFAFHCGHGNNSNGSTTIVGQAKDFGKKMNITLVRSDWDPTVWLIADYNYEYVCAVCGNDMWVTYSNKSGVPNGKNIQFTGIGKYEAPPEDPDDPEIPKAAVRYYAVCQLWNDIVWGNDNLGLTDDQNPEPYLGENSPMFWVGVEHRTALMAYWNITDQNVRYWPFPYSEKVLCEYWADYILYTEFADDESLETVCKSLGIDVEDFIINFDWAAWLDKYDLWAK